MRSKRTMSPAVIARLSTAVVMIGTACLASAGAFSASAATLSTVRINTGGPALTDIDGYSWKADVNFVGGKVASTTAIIADTRKQYVCRDNRYGMTAYK